MKTVLFSYLFVALGGALGAVARLALNLSLQRDVDFPWGTLAANLAGCFIMGILAHLVATSAWFNASGYIPDQYRLLFAVGFCGSFTTLSSLVLEMHTMASRSEYLAAGGYLAVSVVGGYCLFFLALIMMRSFAAGSA